MAQPSWALKGIDFQNFSLHTSQKPSVVKHGHIF